MEYYECDACSVVQTDDEGECPVCGNGSYSDVTPGSGDEEYVCEECGESFDSQAGLSSHSRVHGD